MMSGAELTVPALRSFIKSEHEPEVRGVNVDFCLSLAGFNQHNYPQRLRWRFLEHAAVGVLKVQCLL